MCGEKGTPDQRISEYSFKGICPVFVTTVYYQMKYSQWWIPNLSEKDRERTQY